MLLNIGVLNLYIFNLFHHKNRFFLNNTELSLFLISVVLYPIFLNFEAVFLSVIFQATNVSTEISWHPSAPFLTELNFQPVIFISKEKSWKATNEVSTSHMYKTSVAGK